jgi:hypothetical protein
VWTRRIAPFTFTETVSIKLDVAAAKLARTCGETWLWFSNRAVHNFTFWYLSSSTALRNKKDKNDYRQAAERKKHYFARTQIEKRLHTLIRILAYPSEDYSIRMSAVKP